MTALMMEHDATEALPIMAAREPVRLPRVNLLPPEIIERRALVRLGQRLGGVVLIAALVGGAVAYEAGSGRAQAQTRLTTAQTDGSRLQAEQAQLAPAQQALAAAQQAQQTLKAAMAQEVLWSRYLEEVKLKLPKNARLSNMVLGTAGAGASGSASAAASSAATSSAGKTGTGAAPAGPAPISSATFTGVAASQYAVADWLQNLALVPGFSGPYLSSSTASGASGGGGAAASSTVTFTVTVDVTADALSHRYDDVAGG